MRLYGGRKASRFRLVKGALPSVFNDGRARNHVRLFIERYGKSRGASVSRRSRFSAMEVLPMIQSV